MSRDSQLQQAVLTELGWEPSVVAAHIGVAARSGVVTLTGHVETLAQKHAAEMAARRVKGVRAVLEEIEVRIPDTTRRADGDLANAAVDRLAWDVSVPYGTTQVKVEKGWITLSGQVEWHYQREAAEQDVRQLPGAAGVTNEMTIRPRVDAAQIGDDIVHALHRSWLFDAKTITVTAEEGRIRLTGTVLSAHERQVAAATAWAAPGATMVENELVIV